MLVMFFFQRLISELPRPIALKLCHMVRIWLNFIIPLQKFGGLPPKKIRGQKHAKFGRFLQNPTLIANISGTDRHIENVKKTTPSTTTTSTLNEKNLVNFGPQTTEIQWCILTHLNGFFREKIRGLPPKKIRGQKHAKFGRHRPLRGAAPSNFYTC